MPRHRLIASIASLILAAGTAAAGPVGSAFTYQGQLNVGAAPATGSYDIQFKLYDANTGGVLLGSAAAPGTTVQNGLFTTPVDFGSAAFSGQARWLEIAVRPAGSGQAYTTLSPRQQLTPAPYAVGLALPYTGISETATNLFSLWQHGSAPAAEIAVDNPGSSSPALTAFTTGMGSAGRFRSYNAGSVQPALYAEAGHLGQALSALNTGLGPAALFKNSSTTASGTAVKMENAGPGSVLGISSPQGQGAYISLGSGNTHKALDIAHAGTGNGVVITKTNSNNTGTALVVQAQTPTAAAIDVTRGKIRQVFATGAQPALATPVAYVKYDAHWGMIRSSSGNVTVTFNSDASGVTNARQYVTVTGDPFHEEWIIVATQTFAGFPGNNYRVLTTEPDANGTFQVDVNCLTCDGGLAFNIMQGDINIVIYRP